MSQSGVYEDSLSLRVAEAFIDDVGKALARIDADDLKRIGAVPGDLLLIGGRRSTAAKAAQAPLEYCGKSLLLIDSTTRDNAQAGIDEWVTVRKVPYKRAESLLLSQVDITRPLPGESELSHTRELLAGTPVLLGDKVQVALFGVRAQSFIVEGAVPRGALLITRHTEIAFKPSEVAYERAARVSYEDIGGLDEELAQIREMIELPLKLPELFGRLGIDPPSGVLLSGPPGTGKTLIAKAVSSEVKAHFIQVSGPEIIHKFYGESEAKLREIFEEARRNAPSIIFLDEIDALAPRRAQVIGDVEKRVVAQLLALMDGLVSRGEVVVIGATNMPELVDPALRRPGRFDREITIGVPNRLGRHRILKIHTRRMPLAEDVDLERLADITHGYVGADLAALCKEAGMAALRRLLPEIRFELDHKPDLKELNLEVTAADFMEAFKAIEPTSTRDFLAERPLVRLKDVGGLGDIKRNLVSIMRFSSGVALSNPPKGILFSGPSGTGKTLLAKAIAGELGMTLILADPSALLSKWVGEAEKGIREVFKKAKQASPCILFFDEIETLVPVRSAAEAGGVSQRLVSQLFRELDELQGALGVVVLAATNRIDLVDPALLRPGRFDYVLEFPLPDREERIEVLRIHARDLSLAEDVDLCALADSTQGWTGADLEGLCHKASLLAFEEFRGEERKEEPRGPLSGLPGLWNRHFRQALKFSGPRPRR